MTLEIIAEIGSNHDGSWRQAMALADACEDAVPDCTIKLQCHRGQVVPEGRHPFVDEERSAYYRRLDFDDAAWRKIAARYRGRFMLSVFSVEAARWAAELGATLKVPSGEVENVELLDELRTLDRPVYLSTGMSTVDEIKRAAERLGPVLRCLMHCTSLYPCPAEHVALMAMDELRGIAPVLGFSDHTLGLAASLGAIAGGGARVIERHVGWNRRAYGSDARHSLTLDEFARFGQEAHALMVMLRASAKDALLREVQGMRDAFGWRKR